MKTINVPIRHINVPFYIGQRASDHFAMLDRARPWDLWFHLEDYPSCHIIASVPKEATRTMIKAIIAHGVRLSKEHSKHGPQDVIYRRVRNVTKGQYEGEVVLDH